MLLNKNVSYKAIKKDNHISSCAFYFHYKDGYKIFINPNSINEALALYKELTQEFVTATPIYIQATRLTPILLQLVEMLQMSEVSRSSRMYNKVLD